MASIGLYDWDMNYYIHVPPNLELMKLSSFYKKKYILTNMAATFCPERFTEFIVRKDYEDRIYPNELFLPNVKRGGHAFTGPVYKSLGEEIELMQPDTYCYEKLASLFCTNKTNTIMFEAFMNAQHIRLSLDGKTVWSDYEKTFNRKNPMCYFFHDYDLNAIDGARDLIEEYTKRRKGVVYIGNKFPMHVNNSADLYKWSNFRIMEKNYSIQYDGVMADDAFVDWLERNNHSTMSIQLYYDVTAGCSSENEFAKQRLPKIFNQVIYSWNHRYKISLKYGENFFIDKRWEKVFYFLNRSINEGSFDEISDNDLRQRPLYHYAKRFPQYHTHTTKDLLISDAQEIFQFIREQNYDVFKDLYEKTRVKLKGGELVDDTARNQK